jgi:hypothetical protein
MLLSLLWYLITTMGDQLDIHPLSSTIPHNRCISSLYTDDIGLSRYTFRVHLALGIRVSSLPSPGRKIASDNLARETFNTDIAARFSPDHPS